MDTNKNIQRNKRQNNGSGEPCPDYRPYRARTRTGGGCVLPKQPPLSQNLLNLLERKKPQFHHQYNSTQVYEVECDEPVEVEIDFGYYIPPVIELENITIESTEIPSVECDTVGVYPVYPVYANDRYMKWVVNYRIHPLFPSILRILR